MTYHNEVSFILLLAQGDVGTVNDVSDKDATLNWMMRNKNKQ